MVWVESNVRIKGMKDIWVIANWKSNKDIRQAVEWVEEVGPKIAQRENIKVVVCPPFSDIEEVNKKIQVGNYPMIVGSQDLSPFEEGAYTGEEAAENLGKLIQIAILGHSERRQNFNESDELVAKKVEEAKKNNIIPLVCVQDKNTPVPEGCKLVAYEPVFAIGTGEPDTPQSANEVALELKQKYGNDLEVLYGGSVNAENCTAFIKQDNISGLLIGKASLEAEEFVKIVNNLMDLN